MLGGCASGQLLKWNAGTSNWECAIDNNTTYSASGSGLQLVGTSFSLTTSGVTPGTYNNLTVDALGRVTVGSNITYLTTEGDDTVGNEVTDAIFGGGLRRTGDGTEADPYKLGIREDCLANQILVFNGSEWGCGIDGVVTSYGLNSGILTLSSGATFDLRADFSITDGVNSRSIATPGGSVIFSGGQGITANVSAGSNTVSYSLTNTGTAGTYNTVTTDAQGRVVSGSNISYLTSETDGIVGNEILDATASQGLVRSGTGTALDPFTLGIATGGVNSGMIATNSIDSSKIVNSSIANIDLASDIITSDKILDGTVGQSDLASNSVNSSKIVDASIATADLATGSVDSTILLDGAISLIDLGSNSVNSSKIVDGSIATSDIADGAVGLSKLTACTNAGEILKYNGVSWACSTDSNNTYTAGNGITLTSSTFSINSPTCAGSSKLQWTGTAFICTADIDTTNLNISANGAAAQNLTAGGTIDFVNGTGTTATRSGSQISYSLTNTGTAGTYNTVTTDAQGRVVSGSNISYLTSETDGIVGNEILDATASQGLVRSGTGTALDPFTLGIANNGVTTVKIATSAVDSTKILDGSVSLIDLNSNSVNSAKILDGSIIGSDLANCSAQGQILKYYVTDPDGIGALTAGWNCDADSSVNSWSLNGNAGTVAGANFIGTTDLTDLVFKTNSDEAFRIDAATGNIMVNTVDNPRDAPLIVNADKDKVTGLDIRGDTNSYFQFNIQNLSSGSSASTDIVATANNGTEDRFYVNLGINGEAGATAPFTDANDAYLYSSDTSLNIAALGVTSQIKFFTTGGVDAPALRAVIDDTGKFGIGTDTPTETLDVNGTARIRTLNTASDAQLVTTDANGVLSKRAFPTAGTGLQFGSDAFSLTNVGTAGTYNNVTTDAQGRVVSGSNIAYLTTETDGVIGNEVLNATVAGGLTRSGTGTSGNPFTLGVSTGGITSAMLLDGTILTGDISTGGVTSTNILDGTILLTDLASNSVDGSKIVDGSVSNADLVNSGVTILAGNGLITGGAVALGSSVSLNIGAGNGITINADDVTVDATTTSTTATTSSNSGIESTATGIRLLGGCSDTQVLRWSSGTAVWSCGSVGGISGIGSLDSQTKSANGAVISGNNLILQTADASNAGLVSTGTQTFAGDKTFNNDLNVNANTTLGDTNADITTVTNLVNTGSTLNSALAISNLPTGGDIGTAATTVDIKTTFNVNQTTANQTITLPNPTNVTSGRTIYINNVGTAGFNILATRLEAGQSRQIIWNGTAWKLVGDGVGERNFAKVKGSDQNIPSGTTLTNDTQLFFPVASGETWVYSFDLLVTNINSATPDWKAAILGAAGWTCSVTQSGEEPAGAAFPQARTTDCDNVPTALVNNTINADVNVPFNVRIEGWITTTSPGNVQLQWAANTSGSLTVLAGSSMQAQKVQGADLAEIYYTSDPSIKAGEIVSLTGTGVSQVKKSNSEYAENSLGIVSTKPGQVLGESDGQGFLVPVALTGRVPVKVTAKNGIIKPGDQVTTSDIEGIGMLATKSGRVVGKALTGFTPENLNDQGEIVVFIEPGFWQAPVNFNLSSIFTNPSLSLNNLNTQEILNEKELADLGLSKTPDTTYSGFDQKIVDEIMLGFKTQQDQIKELQTGLTSVTDKLANLDKLSAIPTESLNTTTVAEDNSLKLISGGAKLENGLDLIKNLSVVSDIQDGQTVYNFSLINSTSSLISTDKNNSFISLQDITPILVKSIQEQQKEIENLKSSLEKTSSISPANSENSTGLSFDLESLKASFLADIKEVKDSIAAIEIVNQKQDSQINSLEAENIKLKTKLEDIETRLQKLEVAK